MGGMVGRSPSGEERCRFDGLLRSDEEAFEHISRNLDH
jgi:hypothetical protein